MSRRHAHIELNERYLWEITDVGSLGGTRLNGQRLESYIPAILNDGDRITFCGFELHFTFHIDAYAWPTQTYEEFLASDEFSNTPFDQP
ncbi:MAG: FHA domain-containing protein [Gemmataceae bacterium]|nr:FHA domain-containing protein [Gemmataceae bacterium]